MFEDGRSHASSNRAEERLRRADPTRDPRRRTESRIPAELIGGMQGTAATYHKGSKERASEAVSARWRVGSHPHIAARQGNGNATLTKGFGQRLWVQDRIHKNRPHQSGLGCERGYRGPAANGMVVCDIDSGKHGIFTSGKFR